MSVKAHQKRYRQSEKGRETRRRMNRAWRRRRMNDPAAWAAELKRESDRMARKNYGPAGPVLVRARTLIKEAANGNGK